MDLALVFLGAIALGSLAQLVFVVGLGLTGWRLARRVQGLQADVVRELKTVADSVDEVAHNVAVVTELATAQVQQLQAAVASTVGRMTDARREVGRSLRRPFRGVGAVSALLRGMRRGMRVYRTLSGLEAQRKGGHRRYRDDEHLFI